MVEVRLKTANGPMVISEAGVPIEEILAALPEGWTVHVEDWNLGVKRDDGRWAYPLSRLE
ncbi:MAG: hypothetical protein ABW123_22860 [Cystobacter sp.]